MIPLDILTALLLAAQAFGAEPLHERPLRFANCHCCDHDGRHPERPFQHWTYPASETNARAKETQPPGESFPNRVFRPLDGLYDSADPKVAEWHVKLFEAAGLDTQPLAAVILRQRTSPERGLEQGTLAPDPLTDSELKERLPRRPTETSPTAPSCRNPPSA